MAIAVGWLLRQTLNTKPWIEQRTVSHVDGEGALPLPSVKVGLGVFLAVATSLFSLLVSAYFMRKMAAFVAYHQQGKHTERYGISNFRVITVTPTKQRALNLCQKLENAGLGSNRFWFTDFPAFTTDEPAKILERVFFTPNDFQDGVLYGFRD